MRLRYVLGGAGLGLLLSACQMVGHAAWFLRFQGILAPSASGTGMVLTLFESRLGPGSVLVKSSDDLTLSLYEELSQFVE